MLLVMKPTPHCLAASLLLLVLCVILPKSSSVKICSEEEFVNSCQTKLYQATCVSQMDYTFFIQAYCPSVYQNISAFRSLPSTLQRDFISAVCYTDSNLTKCIQRKEKILLPEEGIMSSATTNSSLYNDTISSLCHNVYTDLDDICHHTPQNQVTTVQNSAPPSKASSNNKSTPSSNGANNYDDYYSSSLPSNSIKSNSNAPIVTPQNTKSLNGASGKTPTSSPTVSTTASRRGASPTAPAYNETSSVVTSRDSNGNKKQESNIIKASSNNKALYSSIKICTAIAVLGIFLALLLYTRQRRERGQGTPPLPSVPLPPDQQISVNQPTGSSIDESSHHTPASIKKEAAFRKTLNILKLRDSKQQGKGNIDPILLLEASSCASSISSISEDQINFLENLIDCDDWMPVASAGAADLRNKEYSNRPKLLLKMDQSDANIIDKFIEEGDWDALAEIAHEFNVQNNRLFDLDGTASSFSSKSKPFESRHIKGDFDLDKLLKEGNWDAWAAEISALELGKRKKIKNVYNSSLSIDSNQADSFKMDNDILEGMVLQEGSLDISALENYSERLSRRNKCTFSHERSISSTAVDLVDTYNSSDILEVTESLLEDGKGDNLVEDGNIKDLKIISDKLVLCNADASGALPSEEHEPKQHETNKPPCDVQSCASSMYMEVVDVQVDSKSYFSS